jgi:hypothetical protein
VRADQVELSEGEGKDGRAEWGSMMEESALGHGWREDTRDNGLTSNVEIEGSE